MIERDLAGNIIYRRDDNGVEEWWDYDANNNITHYRNKLYAEWKTYDHSGNVIHYRNTTGYELWAEYDRHGHLVYCRDSEGLEDGIAPVGTE
jgi:YD repeat-containing protein